MKKSGHEENKVFPSDGKRPIGNMQSVSFPPLFIDARGKEKEKKNIVWKTSRFCLRHGEEFCWKNRCRRCRHLITFQERSN